MARSYPGLPGYSGALVTVAFLVEGKATTEGIEACRGVKNMLYN